MDEMPSSEFRRRYATLTTAVDVTVLGRVIGTWIPIAVMEDVEQRAEERRLARLAESTPTKGPSFNSRPFTPVPKAKGK